MIDVSLSIAKVVSLIYPCNISQKLDYRYELLLQQAILNNYMIVERTVKPLECEERQEQCQ